MANIILPRKTAAFFLVPAILLVGTFLVLPAVWALYIGITDLTLTGRSAVEPKVVWLANFARALRDPFFRNSLRISLAFVVGSALLGQAVLGLGLALLLYGRKDRLATAVSNLAILAWIIPEVVVSYLWVAYLDYDFGLVNRIFAALGGRKVNWFFELPLGSIILFNIWRGTAFSMLLFGAALQTIPPSYIETAEVIGASAWRKFRDIVLPLVKPHVLTDLILITIWTFNVFTPYLLTGGGPAFRTELVSIYTYRTAFRYFKLGYGAAISSIILLINLLLALTYLKISGGRRRVGI